MDQLKGILSALVTPFDGTGAVDEHLLRTVVEHSIDGGVSAVVACGSTGEFAAMSPGERRQVVEIVIDQTAGRVPVVAQTGGLTAAEAIAHSRHAQQAGASMIMPVSPFYEPLTMPETLRYLRAVAASVDIPVMLYNLPPATGVNLDPDTVARLAREVGNIRYLKDTSGNLVQAGQLVRYHGDVVSTFVGWDSLLLPALCDGVAGAMCGTANVIPAELVSVQRAIAAGDLHRARAEWERIYPLIDTLLSTAFIPGVKAAMTARGIPAGAPREPLTPLDQPTSTRIAALIAALPTPAAKLPATTAPPQS